MIFIKGKEIRLISFLITDVILCLILIVCSICNAVEEKTIIDTVSIPSAANVTSDSEEIITGVCTFGDCPVLQPTKPSITSTTEPANDPLPTASLKEESAYSQNTVSDVTETVADNETIESVAIHTRYKQSL